MAIVKWIFGVPALAAVAVCWCAGAGANWSLGYQDSLVWGLVYVGADVAKLICPLALRPAWRDRRPWPFIGCLLIWPLALGVSVASCITYFSSGLQEQAVKREGYEFNAESRKEQVTKQERFIQQLQERQLYARTKADRADFEEQVTRAQGKLDELRSKVTVVKGSSTDALATFLAPWFNPDQTHRGRTISIILLIEVLGGIGLAAFSPMLGLNLESRLATMVGLDRPEVPPPAPETPAAPQIAGVLAPAPRPKAKGKPPLAIVGGTDVEPASAKLVWTDRARVVVDAVLARHGPGLVRAAIVFEIFHELCVTHGWDDLGDKDGHDRLGSGLSNLGVDKKRRRTKGVGPETYYVISNQNEAKTPSNRAG